MKRTFLLLPLTLALLAADPSPEPESPEQTDQRRMSGDWTMVKVLRNGKAMDKELDKVTVIIAKDTITIREPKRDEVAGYTLRASKKPRQIDLQPKNAGAKGELVVQGIYKIEGDTLTICFRKNGKTRPDSFEADDISTLVLKRKPR